MNGVSGGSDSRDADRARQHPGSSHQRTKMNGETHQINRDKKSGKVS